MPMNKLYIKVKIKINLQLAGKKKPDDSANIVRPSNSNYHVYQ